MISPLKPQNYYKGQIRHSATTTVEVVSDVLIASQEQDWWLEENVRTFSFPITYTSRNPWLALVPATPWTEVLDVSIEFVDAHDGASRMAEACFSPNKKKEIIPQLEQSFSVFQQLVQDMCPTIPDLRYKARIVASRGPRGKKCPRWHLDHVPVRWIQSLVGPGCDYVVGERGINRNALNGLDLVDVPVHELNNMMVSEHDADVRHGEEGEAVALVGKGRNKGSTSVGACVHKSPELHPLEGRVLLTVDVAVPASQFEDGNSL